MLARMRHRAARRLVHDARTPNADPTGTADVRRRYNTLLSVRWRKFISLARQALVEQDMLGLRPDRPTTLGLALSALTPDGKTKAFQTWADSTLLRVVLEGEAAYLDPMIEVVYQRALVRAQRLAKFIGVAPTMRDTIHNLQQLTLVELQGVCEAVSQRIVRLAAQAMLDRVKPAQLMQEVSLAVMQVGMVRSRAIVSVMTTKTHSTATLDTFEFAGVKGVGLVPEIVRPQRLRDAGPGSRVSRKKTPSKSTIGRIRRAEQATEREFEAQEVEVETAGDDLVCPECEGIAADGPYTIDEARSLIPAHPECRCAFVNADDARFDVPEFEEDE